MLSFHDTTCMDGDVSVQASLLVGGPGTAKTSIVNQFLGSFLPEETASKTITFSSLTTPAIFQMAIEVCAASHTLPSRASTSRHFDRPHGSSMLLL